MRLVRRRDRLREGRRERAGARAVLFVLLGVALLVGGAWVAAYAVAQDRVPRGTTVAGIEIGGQTQAEAVRTVDRGLGPRTGRDLSIAVGGVTESIAPADLGLGVDVAASVREAGGGRSWRPQRLWDYFTGGHEQPVVVSVDDEVLDARLAELGQQVDRAPVDGAVAFVDAAVVTTAAEVGAEIDAEAAPAALEEAFRDAIRTDTDTGSDSGSATESDTEPDTELVMRDVLPDIDQAEVDAAVAGFATPALAAPITLVFDGTPLSLAPADYAGALAMQAQDGDLVGRVDGAALADLVAVATGDGAPRDASVALVDGRPKVVKSRPGITYDPDDVVAAFTGVLDRPDGQRQADVASTVTKADFSTRDARALKIREKVSEAVTTFPYAEYRNTNIGRAAELVDGTVLEPGETFSFNDVVGERTRANGFTEGFVINNGIFAEDLGGGVSQMATTTYNAAFFAGLDDVEHKPHSFYIDRYPIGREATVAWGSIDLRFADDTPYGVLISAKVTPSTPSSAGVVTVSMWSTETWDIESVTGEPYNRTQPATRTLDTADCYANTGYGGFDIDVTRIFRRPGSEAVDHRETVTTTYTPSDTVVCEPPPADPAS